MLLKITWAFLDVITIIVLLSGLYLWRRKHQAGEEMNGVDLPSSA